MPYEIPSVIPALEYEADLDLFVTPNALIKLAHKPKYWETMHLGCRKYFQKCKG